MAIPSPNIKAAFQDQPRFKYILGSAQSQPIIRPIACSQQLSIFQQDEAALVPASDAFDWGKRAWFGFVAAGLFSAF
jgi:hypothetical protein